MTVEIGPTSRAYPVIRAWLLGMLELLLQNSKGADFELVTIIRRVKENKVTWTGRLPCRDWTKKKRA